MSNQIITVTHRQRTLTTIKKSKFITTVAPVATVAAAEEFIAEVAQEFSDANHNVYAYCVEAEQIYQKYSDDGEPSGTAGRPVFEVLRKLGLSNVAVVVTRYFGGILLGAGGLVRAYTTAAKEGLEAAGIVELMAHYQAQVVCSYADQRQIRYNLAHSQVQVEDIDYQERITFKLLIPQTELDEVQAQLPGGELTLGSVIYRRIAPCNIS